MINRPESAPGCSIVIRCFNEEKHVEHLPNGVVVQAGRKTVVQESLSNGFLTTDTSEMGLARLALSRYFQMDVTRLRQRPLAWPGWEIWVPGNGLVAGKPGLRVEAVGATPARLTASAGSACPFVLPDSSRVQVSMRLLWDGRPVVSLRSRSVERDFEVRWVPLC
jgi:hypothetical protein